MVAVPGEQVIHLDTKDWIGLARGYYGRALELQKTAKMVLDISESGQAIFPLSLVHFIETVKNQNPGGRKRLAEYVIRVSQGWAILPAPIIIDLEIDRQDLVSKYKTIEEVRKHAAEIKVTPKNFDQALEKIKPSGHDTKDLGKFI
jgi:hypothetical protein